MDSEKQTLDRRAVAQIIRRDLNLLLAQFSPENSFAAYLGRLADELDLVSESSLEEKIIKHAGSSELRRKLAEFRNLRRALFRHLAISGRLDHAVSEAIHEFIDLSIEQMGERFAELHIQDVGIREQTYLTELKNVQDLFANSSVIFAFTKGADHRYEYVNQSHIHLMGGRNLTGKTVLEAQPEVEASGVIGLLDRVYQTGEPVQVFEGAVPVGSDLRYFDFLYFPHRNTSGVIDGTLALISDITEVVRSRKALEDHQIVAQKLQSQLSQAVKISKTGFYDWDIAKDQVVFSEQMKEDWGMEANTPLSLALSIVHPDDAPRTEALIRKSVANRVPFKTEYRLVRPTDGKIVWIQAQGQVNYDEKGKAIRFFGTSVDISERKKSEQRLASSEHQLKLITDSLPVLISYLDEDRKYQFLNPAYEDWFKKPRSELLGKTIEEVAGKRAYPVLKPYLDRAYGGEIVEFDQDVIFELSERSIHVIYTPDRDPESGKVRGLVTLVYDVTLQKTTERALKEAIASRDEFLSVASHELKTPLTSMRLQTQMMKRNFTRTTDGTMKIETVSKFVDLADRSADRLTRLVDDMLDMTRISSGALNLALEKFDLSHLVEEVFERILPQAEHQGTLLKKGRFEKVEGNWDRFRIDQVITNLISNALKYGEKSPIFVSVFKDADSAIIQVQDTGPGIAHENQARVFQRFERVSSSPNITGLGLGLHICKEIVERHAGHVTLSSEPGRGATFTVELPLQWTVFES